MSFHEFVDQLKRNLHLDPLEPRVWECNPLLIVAGDDSITYYGPANVEVTPNRDGTANLVADVEVDGWRPSLLSATVEKYVSVPGRKRDGPGTGLVCSGKDFEGIPYSWHIGGAALAYGAALVRGVNSGAGMPVRTQRPAFEDDAVG